MKSDRITVMRFGKGTTTNSCPFTSTGSRCSLKRINCRYGLTEIVVPRACPLRLGGVDTFVFLASSDGLPSDTGSVQGGRD